MGTKLKLIEVRDPGTARERVFMQAVQDVDLGDYIVTDTTYRQNGAVSNKMRHVYEFARKVVKAGECIALHSGAGTYKLDKTTDDGTPLHRFYWGSELHGLEEGWRQCVAAPRTADGPPSEGGATSQTRIHPLGQERFLVSEIGSCTAPATSRPCVT